MLFLAYIGKKSPKSLSAGPFFRMLLIKFVEVPLFSETSSALKNSWLRACSHPEVFCKKVVPKSFAKLTGKLKRWSLYFNKVAVYRPATLLKRDSGTRVSL